MRHLTFLPLALLLGGLSAVHAQTNTQQRADSSFLVPQRAVIVSGDHQRGNDLIAVLYDKSDLHYSDPNAPRFLFLDRQGRVALGIGGYLKGTVQYDFAGSIDDGASFTTYDIPVPNSPDQRSQFYGNVNHSTIFLQLVGRSTKFGYYQMYIQTNFSGNGKGGYGMKLKQAWASLGNVTMGLAPSTFVDGSAGTPTIDDQGPAGEMTGKHVLVRYAKSFGRGWRVAAGIEMPELSVTVADEADSKKINPCVPDIPAYIQYSWAKGASHVRVSGLLRNLSYRDLVAGKNHTLTGWAVQMSGVVDIMNRLDILFQGAYGRGYGEYINDLSGFGFDMVSAETPGLMKMPRTANFEIGAKLNLNDKCFLAASYSEAHLYGLGYLGGDTYRYGRYISASCFYDIIPDLRLGFEYLHGNRFDFSGENGHANRVMAMLQYSF